VAANLLESQHIRVEGNRFLKVVNAISRVQQFFDHGLRYCFEEQFQTARFLLWHALDKAIKAA
jgi:hypothetical protein